MAKPLYERDQIIEGYKKLTFRNPSRFGWFIFQSEKFL